MPFPFPDKMTSIKFYSNMTPKKILALILVAPLLVSCGASRRAAINDYEYQQWKQQQQQQQQQTEVQQQQPSRRERKEEPCVQLALENSEFLRAFGTATSYIEKVAMNEAERDARNRLALMVRLAIEGAASDYEKNASENLNNTAGTLGESIMRQYVAEQLTDTRIIKQTIYDLSNGQIQIYVCIEMRKTLEDFTDKEYKKNKMTE